jgi:hypothetical protein
MMATTKTNFTYYPPILPFPSLLPSPSLPFFPSHSTSNLKLVVHDVSGNQNSTQAGHAVVHYKPTNKLTTPTRTPVCVL